MPDRDDYCTIPFEMLGAVKKHHGLRHWPYMVAVKTSDGSFLPCFSNAKENNYLDIHNKGADAITEYLK